jgi:hypothetical protein
MDQQYRNLPQPKFGGKGPMSEYGKGVETVADVKKMQKGSIAKVREDAEKPAARGLVADMKIARKHLENQTERKLQDERNPLVNAKALRTPVGGDNIKRLGGGD